MSAATIQVTNCEIYECSQGGIQMCNVDGITIADCTFLDLGGDRLTFNKCKNVSIDGKTIDGTLYSGN